MMLCQSLGVAVAVALSLLRWLPMPLILPPEFAELQDVRCPYFPWCLCMSFLGIFLGLLLVPYSPSIFNKCPVCFLDVVSIHQAPGRSELCRGTFALRLAGREGGHLVIVESAS